MVIMTHQTLSLEKYWKLLPATLSHFLAGKKIKQEIVFMHTAGCWIWWSMGREGGAIYMLQLDFGLS